MNVKSVTLLDADRHHFHPLVRGIDFVEDPEVTHSKLPFSQSIGAEPFPVPRFLIGLMDELGLNRRDQLLLVELPQRAEVVDRFMREVDLEHTNA